MADNIEQLMLNGYEQTSNTRDYVDISRSSNSHMNLTSYWDNEDYQAELDEYSDYSKAQLHYDTCDICWNQQCYVHYQRYPMPPQK